MSHSSAIGVDLGGTNLRAALVNLVSQTTSPPPLVGEYRVALTATDPESVASQIAKAIEEVVLAGGDKASQAPVGIGVAGMLRGNTGVVENAPNLGWRGVPLRDLVKARLPGRAIDLYNDVNAIAFGEFTFGAGRDEPGQPVRDIICVFAGTGVGGGIVCGGQLVEGGANLGGEIGHVKVASGPTARRCGCGARGCLEAYAGGLNLQLRIRAELAAGNTTAALALAGGDASAVHAGHIDQAAGSGDSYANALWDEIAPLFGSVLANAVTLLNPTRLILGGGVFKGAPELRRRTLAAYQALVNDPSGQTCKVVDALLDDEAGLLGAAALAANLCELRQIKAPLRQ